MSYFDEYLETDLEDRHQDNKMDKEHEHEMGMPSYYFNDGQNQWDTPLKQKMDAFEIWREYYTYKLLEYATTRFTYEGLPESITTLQIETILVTNGAGAFFRDLNFDNDLMFLPTISTRRSIYFKPKKFTVRTLDQETVHLSSKDLTDKTGVYMADNMFGSPFIIRAIHMFAAKLAQNEMDLQRNSRQAAMPKYVKGHRNNLGTIQAVSSEVEQGGSAINIITSGSLFDNLKETLDLASDYKGSDYEKAKNVTTNEFLQAIGMPATEADKAQYVNRGEVYMPTVKATALLYTYLKLRKEAVEKVNQMFQTKITVKLSEPLFYADYTNLQKQAEQRGAYTDETL